MSVKFEVNVESLFERLFDYIVQCDDMKAMTFYNKHQKIRITLFSETETNFDLISSSPDDECFQIIILFLVSAQYIYPVHSKTELQNIILNRK